MGDWGSAQIHPVGVQRCRVAAACAGGGSGWCLAVQRQGCRLVGGTMHGAEVFVGSLLMAQENCGGSPYPSDERMMRGVGLVPDAAPSLYATMTTSDRELVLRWTILDLGWAGSLA